MSDDFEVIDMPRETLDSQTWARKLMVGVRAVQELHHPVTLYDIPGFGTFDDHAQAEAYVDENQGETGIHGEAPVIETFTVCAECARIEGEDVDAEAAAWPCRTAVALGIQEGPLL